ncbi:MAG: proline dehydrogenase family protein [Methyloceanibacter sp.]|nr:proline dehydrogenase family protein [Methyloceanibacter sp.]
MLGEAARTGDDAERYALRYDAAAEKIAAWAGAAARSEDELLSRPGLSVKLSALHPRYQPSQEARLNAELLPRLSTLAHAMRDAWLPLTIDAEEAERLDLSLALMQPLFADLKLAGWNGLGLAVQAYSKRALPLIEWLASVARATGRRIPVRLVKGAYWDSEIKWAQEAGLTAYPVFTRKVNTDVAYLTAARALLARPDCFYPQHRLGRQCEPACRRSRRGLRALDPALSARAQGSIYSSAEFDCPGVGREWLSRKPRRRPKKARSHESDRARRSTPSSRTCGRSSRSARAAGASSSPWMRP